MEQSLTFSPNLPGPISCFVPCGAAWGVARFEAGRVDFELIWGDLTLAVFGMAGAAETFAPRRLRAHHPPLARGSR